MSDARTAADIADIDVQGRADARRDSPRADHRIGDDHGKRVARAGRRARAVAMPASMSIVVSQNDLSLPGASRSEHLDKHGASRYGLELVIPMLIRRLETR